MMRLDVSTTKIHKMNLYFQRSSDFEQLSSYYSYTSIQ